MARFAKADLELPLAAAGFALLLLPLLFVLHMTLTYNVGFAYPLQHTIDSVLAANLVDGISPLLVLGGPLLAAALNTAAVLRVSVRTEEEHVVCTASIHRSPWNLAVLAVTGLLLATVITYLAGENLSCLTGAQSAC